ncbi:hypothetical protein [Salinibacter grassmerensis]|uniref:hypothetical protein n=1 Tax=Salinibacter grassmerensis TaxID=3040353 RepID=UPI0021E7DBF7|nr:hypothetical protein [Salinibacter grassmerensis]
MKRSLVFAALLLCASLTSCQCSNQPDVGPVEGEEEQAHRIQTEITGDRGRIA